MADAHRVVFGEIKDPNQERLDFALAVADEEILLGYVNCREMETGVLYWGYGGALPSSKNTRKSWPAYCKMLEKTWELGYARIFTYIQNTNATMLKFAAKAGFLIVGTQTIGGETHVGHILDAPNEN